MYASFPDYSLLPVLWGFRTPLQLKLAFYTLTEKQSQLSNSERDICEHLAQKSPEND